MTTPDAPTAPTAAPTAAPPSRIAVWLVASRPKTLSAALAPVIVGTAVAHVLAGVRWGPAIAALVGALLIQIATNFANDYFDFKKGADTADRLGPLRVTQAGWVTPRATMFAMTIAFALTLVPGAYLVFVGGWPIVAIGVASIICGVAYTGGPYPLGYNGLGDVFVFIFFGLIAVMGTVYVQTMQWSWLAAVCGVPIGGLAAAILAVNNVRDAETDQRAGKRTVAVRFGVRFAQLEHTLLVVLAFAVPVGLAIYLRSPWPMLTWLALPIALGPSRGVWRLRGAALNPVLADTAKLLAIYSLLFAVGLCLAA